MAPEERMSNDAKPLYAVYKKMKLNINYLVSVNFADGWKARQREAWLCREIDIMGGLKDMVHGTHPNLISNYPTVSYKLLCQLS